MKKQMHYQVNEIFDSIQGEGYHSGRACTFIRLQGCSVGCPWCDTKYTWKKGGTKMHVKDILEEVHYEHVIITGGEPTLWNLDPLIIGLLDNEHYIHMESSGQNNLKGLFSAHWVVWSPKENLNWDAPPEFKRLVQEVKFVVDDRLQIETVLEIELWFSDFYAGLEQSTRHPVITLMPEGCPPSEQSMKKAFDWCMQHPRWRFSDRVQYRLGVK